MLSVLGAGIVSVCVLIGSEKPLRLDFMMKYTFRAAAFIPDIGPHHMLKKAVGESVGPILRLIETTLASCVCENQMSSDVYS